MRAALALLVLGLPTATACSLVDTPFAHASFHDGDLWYSDGFQLRRVHGNVEATVVEGFFLSHAVGPDGTVLVGGQSGLGADCSGDTWLELRDEEGVLWREDVDRPSRNGFDGLHEVDRPTVFPHGLGPFVRMRDAYWRLDGDTLVEAGRPRAESWTLGWTSDGEPVEQVGDRLHVGDRWELALEPGRRAAVAAQGGELAIVQAGERSVSLRVLGEDGAGTAIQWDPGDGWQAGVAWSGGWVVLAGERAYRVDGSGPQDLGVAGARSLAHRDTASGPETVVFTQDGYTVFRGSRATEAWRRDAEGLWTPVAPEVGPHRSVTSSRGPMQASPAPTDGIDDGGDGEGNDDGVLTVPGPVPAGAMLVLAAAAAALRSSLDRSKDARDR